MKPTALSIVNNTKQVLFKTCLLLIATLVLFITSDFIYSPKAHAYPFWAQQAYPISTREATGRIVCANCHLASKPTEVEIPTSVLPDTVFEAVVKVPYNKESQQVLGDGSKGGLNVGAVLMLPPGFKIAPEDRIPEELKEKTEGLYYQQYSEDQENVVFVGPLPGEEYQSIVFPVLSPNPETDKGIHFGKYAIHAGGNRGRGQVYLAGNKSNNAVYNASIAGTITNIEPQEEGGYAVTITPSLGDPIIDLIPSGPELIVAKGDEVKAAQAITKDPNVGGFGQDDAEIVLQSPTRIKWLIAFIAAIMLSQVLLVIKKKQVEKVQAAEMTF